MRGVPCLTIKLDGKLPPTPRFHSPFRTTGRLAVFGCVLCPGLSAQSWTYEQGRRNCDFSISNPATQCADGGCNGGLECDPHTGTGVPPATVAEFTLGGTSGQPDNYDVSLVDGFNLPMSITNNVGCGVADCPVDLGPNCPSALHGPFDSSGYPVGCKSACDANLSGDPSNSPNCCSGNYDTKATCPSSGVQYYSYFKDNCPNSYCYAYDEASGTALWTCDVSKEADYTITFCPSSS